MVDINFKAPASAPPGLTVIVTGNSAALSWIRPSRAVSYQHRSKLSSSVTWGSPQAVTGLTATVASLQAGVSYDFQVRAVNVAGSSAWSATVTALVAPATVVGVSIATPAQSAVDFAQTQASPPTPLPASTRELVVSWSAVTGADYYGYQVRESLSGSWSIERIVAAPALTATVTGLTSGTAYDIRVRARNAAGAGSWSAVVTETTTAVTRKPGLPSAPRVRLAPVRVAPQLVIKTTAASQTMVAAVAGVRLVERPALLGWEERAVAGFARVEPPGRVFGDIFGDIFG